MMSDYPPPQIIVKHQNIDLTIKFSNISQIDSPEKALETFVAELHYALAAIHIVWSHWSNEDKVTEIGGLLETISQAVLRYVRSTADYIEACIHLDKKSSIQQAQRAGHFEKNFEPLLDQLRTPITELRRRINFIHAIAKRFDEWKESKKSNELEASLSSLLHQTKDNILLDILRPYIEHHDEVGGQEEVSTVPLPETAMVEAFIRRHFKETIADRIQSLKRISEDSGRRERKHWSEEEAQEWFEEHRQKFENLQIKIVPSSLDGGFFRKYRIFNVATRNIDDSFFGGMFFHVITSKRFGFDGEVVSCLHQNQAQMEAMFRAEARPFHEANPYQMAKLLSILLLPERDHSILSSDVDILQYALDGYEFNVTEMKNWLGQIEPPKISGDQQRGWRLEFSSLYGVMNELDTIANHRFFISPSFSIKSSKRVLTNDLLLDYPYICIDYHI